MYLSSILYSMPFVMIPDVPLGFFDHDQVLSHHFQRNNNSLQSLTEKWQCFVKSTSLHVQAMFWVFFSVYIIFSVSTFKFISYFIAKSLSILQVIINSFIHILKNSVLYELHCLPAASNFQEPKPILDAQLQFSDYAYCSNYDFFLFFFLRGSYSFGRKKCYLAR